MTAPLAHNALYRALQKMAKASAPMPTFAQYLNASEDEQNNIRERWCRIAHRYEGDGSQANEAMQLYIRSCNELRKQGKLKPIYGGARLMGDDEEYPGEAEDRGLSPSGFNLDTVKE